MLFLFFLFFFITVLFLSYPFSPRWSAELLRNFRMSSERAFASFGGCCAGATRCAGAIALELAIAPEPATAAEPTTAPASARVAFGDLGVGGKGEGSANM